MNRRNLLKSIAAIPALGFLQKTDAGIGAIEFEKQKEAELKNNPMIVVETAGVRSDITIEGREDTLMIYNGNPWVDQYRNEFMKGMGKVLNKRLSNG